MVKVYEYEAEYVRAAYDSGRDTYSIHLKTRLDSGRSCWQFFTYSDWPSLSSKITLLEAMAEKALHDGASNPYC